MIDFEYILRDSLDRTYKDYDNTRNQLIESFTWRQFKLYRKAMRQVKRDRGNIIYFDTIDILKITKDKRKVKLFNEMKEDYKKYIYFVNRSKMKVVA